MRKNHKGFVVLEALLILIIIGLLAGVGWYVYNARNADVDSPTANETAGSTSKKSQPTTIAAVGDIACSPDSPKANGSDPKFCQSDKVLALTKNLKPGLVLGLGDLQYDYGKASEFQGAFGPSWGQLKDNFYPAPGNHEYETPNAAGYFGYFNYETAQNVKINQSYYSFDFAGWHIISLNSNCGKVDCTINSAQVIWLEQDLNNSKARCTLAFWHHPRFTSGGHSEITGNKDLEAFWKVLFTHRADLILNGHDHIYERYAPQTLGGQADKNGPRQIIVGTGGKELYSQKTKQPNSEIIIDDQFGVLELELFKGAYRWRFVNIDNKVLDSGYAQCV